MMNDTRFYNSKNINIDLVGQDLVKALIAMGYQAQKLGDQEQVLIQVKKGSDLEALLGMQAAISLTLQRTSGGIMAMIGQQKWIDKIAVGAVGFIVPVLMPLTITSGLGALRQINLANEVMNMADGLIRQQDPQAQSGPAPATNL